MKRRSSRHGLFISRQPRLRIFPESSADLFISYAYKKIWSGREATSRSDPRRKIAILSLGWRSNARHWNVGRGRPRHRLREVHGGRVCNRGRALPHVQLVDPGCCLAEHRHDLYLVEHDHVRVLPLNVVPGRGDEHKYQPGPPHARLPNVALGRSRGVAFKEGCGHAHP